MKSTLLAKDGASSPTPVRVRLGITVVTAAACVVVVASLAFTQGYNLEPLWSVATPCWLAVAVGITLCVGSPLSAAAAVCAWCVAVASLPSVGVPAGWGLYKSAWLIPGGVITLVLYSSSLAQLGERLGNPRLVQEARWAASSVVTLGLMFIFILLVVPVYLGLFAVLITFLRLTGAAFRSPD